MTRKELMEAVAREYAMATYYETQGLPGQAAEHRRYANKLLEQNA